MIIRIGLSGTSKIALFTPQGGTEVRDCCVSLATAPGVVLDFCSRLSSTSPIPGVVPPASIQSSVPEYPEGTLYPRGMLSSCIAIYTAVLGFGFLRRSISCIPAVVCAVLSCNHEKITNFRATLSFLSGVVVIHLFLIKKKSYNSLACSIAVQARAASSRISIAGSFLPSRNSRKAPPPVDI